MDSFFGIGPMELIFILIFALIFLGPERLPGAVRQIANIIRQIRDLSGTLSSQLGEEFGDIRELDPRYQIQKVLDEPNEKEIEKAKKAEEKKKAEAKKKADAKKAEDKRKADEKKRADEAAKKAVEAQKAAQGTAAAQSATAPAIATADDDKGEISAETPSPAAEKTASTDSTEAQATPETDGSAPSDDAAASAAPEEKQPKQRSKDDQTSPASAPFVKQKADAAEIAAAKAAANSLIPKASENSIAPPTPRAETAVNGNGDDSPQPDEAAESPDPQRVVVEEEQA